MLSLHKIHLQVTSSCARIGNVSINLDAGGWLTIWLFSVDGVFVSVLNGYMVSSFLTLTMSHIVTGGGGSPRLRLAIIANNLIISVAQETLLELLSWFKSFKIRLGLS